MNERNSIGIIELASIHKGFEVQDAVLKSANVEKLIARTICSGKYFIIDSKNEQAYILCLSHRRLNPDGFN